MFLRKLLVVVLPLLLCFLLGVLFPFLSSEFPGLGFFLNVIKGLLMGVSLAMLIPLSGARRRESFSGLYFIPAALLFLTLLYQYLFRSGVWQVEALTFFAMAGGEVIFTESAFMGFLSAVAIRAARYPRIARGVS